MTGRNVPVDLVGVGDLMRFRMLGPLRIWDGKTWVPIRAAQQRVVMAVLLTRAGQLVSADRLVDEIWGETPPRAALSTIQGYVMRLRRQLGAGSTLVTRGSGYELVVDAANVDAMVFERLSESGRRALADGRLTDAAARLSEALALWRGPALADVPAGQTVAAEVARLEQSRLSVLEDRLGAELQLGRHAEVVDELLRLVDEHPLRERQWRLLMLALYRSGRRAEALDAYRRACRVLSTELGVEPGPELRRTEQAIVAGDLSLAAPAPQAATLIPAQLPPDVAGFTGRDAYLKQLDSLLTGDGGPRPVLMISALEGAAGVGKTALAVHWAQQIRDRFPDGQLHINLRGYATGQPLRPIEALARFLPALGVPVEQVPGDLDEAAALYRSALDGRRMLILLDNANHADQVRPLLPGSPGCLVVVTSRDRLDGLVARDGAVRLNLDVLHPDEAEALLAELLDADRIAREPAAAAELARLCGYLPLALRIAAANLTAHPRHSIAGYAAELAGIGRLTALEVPDDPQASVRPAFEGSYAALPDDARALFRLLGRVPGSDITVPAAAALAGTAPDPAARRLDRLAAAHLVEEHIEGRYTMHDLVRLYAAELPAADADLGLARLYEFCLRHVTAAASQLYPEVLRLPSGSLGSVSFGDHTEALAWLDAERANLVAAVRHTAEHGPHEVAWRLADAMRGYLNLGVHTVDWLAVAVAGLTAAQSAGDLRAQASAHLSLAVLNGLRENSSEALDHDRAARSLSARVGWDEGESAALGHLAIVHRRLGELRQASEHLTAALAIDRRTGWRAGEATKLANLGVISLGLGRLDQATRYYTEALNLQRQDGSRTGEARSMTSLGELHHLSGRTQEAKEILTDALARHRETGDRIAEGYAMRVLAGLYRDVGKRAEAIGMARATVAVARETGDRRAEADALGILSSLDRQSGHHQQVVDWQRHVVSLAREIGDRYGETEALINLAAALRRVGSFDESAAHALTGLLLARRSWYRLLEGQALTVLAALRLRQGRTTRAAGHARHALTVHAETGHRLGQAQAHLILAALGEGRDHHDKALALFTEIGVDPTTHPNSLLTP